MQCFTTIMQPPQQFQQYHGLDKSLLAERAEALEEMLKEFEGKKKYSDDVSVKLVNWGNSFLDEMGLHGTESIEKIIEFANPFFLELNFKILRDDFRSAPDNSKVFTIDDTPVIGHEFEGTFLWSKRIYQRCLRACNKKSPIDGKPMMDDPAVHVVAKAFIDWKELLFPRSCEGTTALALPLTETDLLMEKRAFHRLGAFANIYRMAKEGVEETNSILKNADASQQAAFAALMQARADAEQEKKILIDEKEALKAQYQERERQLDEQFTANQAWTKEQMEKIQKEITEAKKLSAELAEDQKKRLEKLEQEDRKTKEAWQKEKKDLQQHQEMKAKELADRQTEIEFQSQKVIAKMKKDHEQAFNAFIAQMGNNTAEIEFLKKSLEKQTQTSMVQKGMIEGLETHTIGLERDVAVLGGKKRGGNNCSLM